MSFALAAASPLSQRLRGGVVRLRAALTLLGSARRVNSLALRAQLRRSNYCTSEPALESLSLGDLHIDLLSRDVRRGEKQLKLSQREFDLLAYLVQHHDQVQPRQTILDNVWGAPFVGDPNTLDVYMGYLRRKVEMSGQPTLLHTIRGVGFMARVEPT